MTTIAPASAQNGHHNQKGPDKLQICLISLHGLIRAHEPELGRDADTGGQIIYVLELAKELAAHEDVESVQLLTRQVIDPKIDDDYSRLEESISDNAKIIRIPFGPKRYLKKEALWPYLEMFVDQTLQHFKRHGLPDIIHGHYADAGYAGAQLARLLHIPYVFTGHSLGRVKRQRLSLGKSSPETLEKRYKLTTRIEAEEIALETASMVVTSTNQEVVDQYELYDHYVPARMEVIPPGVDLSRFQPSGDDRPEPQIATELKRFLNEPDKPMILAVARPDERKNLEQLVHVFGSCPELQAVANLVLVMGARDNIEELPKSQQTVLSKVLHLIDRYDLYGRVAYPKQHVPDDIPELYRLAVSTRGVFINPALTEPFGLTLLEAGATGLPIIATNDGGPRDIIVNCKNGVLIDPMNREDITHALLRSLQADEEWNKWSEGGIKGTREHYSWRNHANRYLRDLADILDHSQEPTLVKLPKARRIPDFDRLIITDLDNTLTGDPAALAEFNDLIRSHDYIGFGVSTGRRLDSAMALIEELGLPTPDLIDTDAGTKLQYGDKLTPDSSWQRQIGYAWQPDRIHEVLATIPGLKLQPDDQQSEFKISYVVDSRKSVSTSSIKKLLREAKLRAKVIWSLGMYLDVIPVRGGSDMTMRHVLWKWGFSPENVLVAGDSGNDAGMLLGRTLGVVVGNYSKELRRLRNRPRVYFAQQSHASGILEGIQYYNFLDKIVIPNDRIE